MKIKVGVIGLGFMGHAHVRVYSQLKECELIAICDIDPAKKYLAEKYRCKFFKAFPDLLKEELDAVSICTPTSTHTEIALEALKENKHILIEKPLTTNVEDAENLIKKEKKSTEVLAVGYTERFNAAVNKLKEIVDFRHIYSTISFRFGPYPPRIKDIGVLLDLGSHEIDLLNYLTKTQPKILYAYVSSHSSNNFEDYAYVSLKYGHIHSHLQTSWLSNYKLRHMNLYGAEKFYSLDYAQQKLKHYRAPSQIKVKVRNWQDILRMSRNIEGNVTISHSEPLESELKCFIKSIKKGEILDPLCSVKEALEVLKVIKKAFNKVEVSK